MLKRIIYMHIAFSLFLLLPSIYGVIYCFVTENMIELVPSLENEIIKSINIFENEKLVCQIEGNYENESSHLTASKIVEIDKEIGYKSSDCFSQGFNDLIADYTYFVLKINSNYTSNIENIRSSIIKLKDYIFETRRNSEKLFCYIDERTFERLQLTDEETSRIFSSSGEDESYFTKLLSERLKAEYGESLESIKAEAQENLKNHIAMLKEYLNAIRTARMAHEPYRPTIRFIGWAWLIFEITGMILLLREAFIVVMTWRKKKNTA